MGAAAIATATIPVAYLFYTKAALTVGLLALLWGVETWQPFFARREGRLRHAGHNLALALGNTIVLALAFGTATALVAEWAGRHGFGLLYHLGLGWPARLVIALVLLDGWTYLWHRANHALPLLWRFHRMHHSDNQMDVTTATRFHLGEHVGSSLLRLGLIPLLGLEIVHLLVYDTLLIAVTQLHHANVSLGRWDRWLRLLIVTPDLHKVHHSRWRPETDSNFASVLSVWDRLGGTSRLRDDPATIAFGLDEFDAPEWQTVGGMLRTPFASVAPANEATNRVPPLLPKGQDLTAAPR
jgi:sterol desaturase/sphingolipid hydroxylase (fatty acid hydroxylase superfamily)